MNQKSAVKVRGQRGSWFASAEGERLPCVHAHWFRDGWYHDPGARPGERQWDEFIVAIRASKKVIMTTDDVSDGNFARTGYVAIFDVDEVSVEDGVLRFRFVGRLVDAK